MSATSERPTVLPTFDVETFARESDDRIVAARPVEVPEPAPAPADPSSEMRMTARPALGDFLGLETWAREASGVLVVDVSPQTLRTLPLDHRAGFLLSRMDGTLDLDTLVEVSSMEREEVLRIVRDLWEKGVVVFR